MILTPADVLMWTGIPVSILQLAAFEQAAEARLDADGGSAITGVPKKQLLSYLVAGYLDVAAGNVGKQSESMGDYRYSLKSTTGASIWFDLYTETLSSRVASAGQLAGSTAVSRTGLVTRTDTDVVQMNRQFPNSTGRLI